MKTVRLSKLVVKSGAPETYLILRDSATSRTLLGAVKTHAETVAIKTNHCGISFHPGSRRDGCVELLADAKSGGSFIKAAKHGRIWVREPSLHCLD